MIQQFLILLLKCHQQYDIDFYPQTTNRLILMLKTLGLSTSLMDNSIFSINAKLFNNNKLYVFNIVLKNILKRTDQNNTSDFKLHTYIKILIDYIKNFRILFYVILTVYLNSRQILI